MYEKRHLSYVTMYTAFSPCIRVLKRINFKPTIISSGLLLEIMVYCNAGHY